MTLKQKFLAWLKENRELLIVCGMVALLVGVILVVATRNNPKVTVTPEPTFTSIEIDIDTEAGQAALVTELMGVTTNQTGLAPCLYQMFDAGTDFQTLYPQYGAVGSVQYYMWDDLNPSSGAYNWSLLDKNLALDRALTVTLASGAVISKPVIIQIIVHISEKPGWKATFYDATPWWVYDQIDAANPNVPCPIVNGRKVGHALSGCGGIAVLPAYENAIWQACYWRMVQALAAHVQNQPQVVAVIVSTGLDSETQPVKAWGCDWAALLGTQAPGVEYRFSQYIPQAMAVYRAAFPTKTLLLNNVPGGPGLRESTSKAAAALGIGLKNSSLWTDRDSATGGGTGGPGMWDTMAWYSDTLTTMWESVYGMGNASDRLWSFYAGLHFHPEAIDVHPEFLSQSKPEWLQFVGRHLGVTLATTEDIWTVFRKQEYPKQEWSSNGVTSWVSGWSTDWQFWLYRTSQNTIINQADLSLYPEIQNNAYSRQVLKLEPGESVTLRMADGWREGPYTIEVIAAGDGTLMLGATGRDVTTSSWRTLSYTLMGGQTFTLQATGGTMFLHRVTVKPWTLDPTPLATPTYTATATVTRTSTPTVTLTRTPTQTATKTQTPTALPTSTYTPVPTPTKTPGCRCTCECTCTCE